ncbi:uncharacterized protein LOC118751996 [Rhagoletis pomonella]|uniref:uncharacterized protein LOC118751996 n=1 Tax=Rhagoletis pomonella TaxID=28610 RepID=UPI0017876B19|nr:uncharacterized protein LOC118751996 [Rhagoletis pomonella]
MQPPLTSILLKNLSSNAELWPVEEAEFEDLELDGLEHLAGYICHKLQEDIPSPSFRSNDDHSLYWADHLSEEKPKNCGVDPYATIIEPMNQHPHFTLTDLSVSDA